MTARILPELFGRRVTRVHCVGVGGMGVAPLAIYLAGLGFAVSGEDDALTPEVRTHLLAAGVTLGALPENAELVAVSSAIAKSHPVYVAATARGLRIARRGELLAEIVRGKKLVAVCGSHGKTTTTAMLVTALNAAEFPTSYLLGGLFAGGRAPAQTVESEWVVAEIDESDGTINGFSPEITVAVNLDWDHPDHYRRLEDLEKTFAALFGRTRGAVLINQTCELSKKIAVPLGNGAGIQKQFSFGDGGDFTGSAVAQTDAVTTLSLGGKFFLRSASIKARGAFNLANAMAAMAAAELMGATLSLRSLADFRGVLRRQSVLPTTDGMIVLEDYAHHPAEIRALLGSLRRQVRDGGRLVVIFQPHRFSRTAQFKKDFAAALALADSVHLLEVYSAGEVMVAGGTTSDLKAELENVSSSERVHFVPENDTAFFAALSADARIGDLVAFVGAGDIDRKARAWLAQRERSAASDPRWSELEARVRPRLSAGAKLKREEPLATKTTIRIGGAARVYAEPATVEDVQALLEVASALRVDVFVLGRGSNLIVPDDGVDGLVLSLAHEKWARFELREGGMIWAGAGLRLKNLCGLAVKAGLVGFEFLEGIPGNVGGALRMNAGAMGGWMFDVVEEVQLVTRAGDVRVLKKAEMHVGYRHCPELEDAIALGALLKPAALADAEAVSRQIDVYRRKRQESQPRDPSAGCIFKNPPGNSAGRLIDESGLKGERVGDAEVSTVHANFIVNRGKATSAELIELVRRVRATVWEKQGMDLEPEVLLYGKKWEDVL